MDRNRRYHVCVSAAMASGTSGSSGIRCGEFNRASIKLPTGFKGLKIFFRVAEDQASGSTFKYAHEQNGTLCSTVVPASDRAAWYPVPNTVMDFARQFQIVGATVLTSNSVFRVSLKA